jgi:hypothetical protein
MPLTSGSSAGHFMSSCFSRATRILEITRLRYHFLFAGITYHGAHGVLHRLTASS